MESPYKESLDWSKWFVFWLDERVVPKNHPDSNYLLAYDHFLSKVHFSLIFIILIANGWRLISYCLMNNFPEG